MLPVYISLTTISKRIHSIYDTILSLFAQTYPIEEIHLYISSEAYLLDDGIQIIPHELQRLANAIEGFKIIYTENTGPYRKLLPILKTLWNQNAIIITVDDDKIYHKNMVETMVDKYIEEGGRHVIANRAQIRWNTILGGYCLRRYRKYNRAKQLQLKRLSEKVDQAHQLSYAMSEKSDYAKALSFFEGNDGVLYHTKFFTPLIFQFNLIKKLAKTHDDFWFKMCALINGHGVVCLYSYKKRISEKKANTAGSALHFNLNAGTYHRDLRKICTWFKKENLL
jgi:hypothetical protein